MAQIDDIRTEEVIRSEAFTAYPNPDPDEVHFQTKFCANCRASIFLVPLARLRAVGAEQVKG